MGIIWDFVAFRSKSTKTIGYSDGCANVGTAGGWFAAPMVDEASLAAHECTL